MSHAYYHSLGSAKIFGGQPVDYIPIHNWLDASKITMCDARHRVVRHHIEGALWAEEVFGKKIHNSDGDAISVSSIAEQHLREDHGSKTPSISDWLENLHLPTWIDRDAASDTVKSVSVLSEVSAKSFGGCPDDYFDIHKWMLDPLHYMDRRLEALAVRHHSFGIFWCQEVFGEYITTSSNRRIPVRLIAEDHIKAIVGRIPTVENWAGNIKRSIWMNYGGYRMSEAKK